MSTTNWNPSDKHADIGLSNFNRTAYCSGTSARGVRSINPKSTGKWYFEVWLSSGTPAAGLAIGVGDNAFDLSLSLNDTAQTTWCIDNAGDFYDNGSSIASSTALADSDIIGIAVDLDNGYMWVYVNNALLNGSTDPPTAANADFTTLAGTLYPCFSTTISTNAGTGAWLDTDMAYTPPTGFSAWDDGAILPEILESDAVATATMGPGGSALSITLTETPVATATFKGARGYTFTATAEATDDLIFRRGVSLASNAVAQATATGIGQFSLTLTSSAVASSEAVGKLSLLLSATGVAQADLTFRRGVSLASDAVAVATVKSDHTMRLDSAAIAAEVAEGRRTFLLAATAVASADLIGQRTVTVTATSDAVAAATYSGRARIAMLLSSDAVASEQAKTIAHMMSTLTSEAEAEDRLRLPGGTFAALWTNTTTAAAASWDGVLVNSMIEDGGNVYGAGPEGLYVLTPKEKDAGARIPVSVLWDLTDFGSAHRKRLGAVYVSGYAKDGFTVRVVNPQGAFEYVTRLPGHAHASNYRALPGKGLDSQFYRIGVDSRGYCECNAVIVDILETDRRI